MIHIIKHPDKTTFLEAPPRVTDHPSFLETFQKVLYPGKPLRSGKPGQLVT